MEIKKPIKMNKIKSVPRFIDFEWEGVIYQHRVWIEYNQKIGDIICSSGPSKYSEIQIFRWFGVKNMKDLLHLIECGFKNQEEDRVRRQTNSYFTT